MTEEQVFAELSSDGDTETEAAARLAAAPVTLEEDFRRTTALPPGWTLNERDLEADDMQPRRSRGEIVVGDAASFARAVEQRQLVAGGQSVGGLAPSMTLYANESTQTLVAILNDDDGSLAGWRDYRVRLQLIHTPEWVHWMNGDGAQMGQEAFAEHVENGLTELLEPEAAEMLEIAQRFHATTAAQFKSARRLSSGEQQFAYEETVNADAGTIEIPQRLKIAVAPFYGSARYEIGAWFRWRLPTRDRVTMGYKLDRPNDVIRAAFVDQVNVAREALGGTEVINGPAPQPTS